MKLKKVLLTTMLFVLFLFCGINANAAEIINSVNCGATDDDNVVWTLYDDGLVTIVGNGAMADIHNDNWMPDSWDQWTFGNFVKRVEISDGVTSIGNYAFNGFYDIMNVEIPDSVTRIGSDAFFGCNSLKSIDIPDSVTSIGDGAFGYCTSLASVTISDNVTSIGSSVFRDCNSLTNVIIPDGVTAIGDNLFLNCNNLENVTVPDSVTSIGSSAFSSCSSLTSITIPDGVTEIGSSAFYGCTSITSITVPDSVTEIGPSAFSGCTSLANIKLSENITTVAEGAFYGCTSLQSISIPERATSVSEGAFYGCTGLTSVNICDNLAVIHSNSFYNCNVTNVYYIGAENSWNRLYSSAFNSGGNGGIMNATVHYSEKTEKEPETSILLTLGQKEVVINGESVENDVAPKAVNNRTMLPIRVVAEALGAKVEWFGDTSTVRITADGVEISLVIGDSFATVNNEIIELDSPSFVENGRTYLPLRFVSEKLGADVEWNGETQSVYITK